MNLLQKHSLTSINSDTVGPTLVALWYFLALYPEHAVKVKDELKGIDTRDITALATLPHLNGVINETLRLLPPGLSMGSRKTSPNGLLIDGTHIPGNVKIVSPRYTISRCKYKESTLTVLGYLASRMLLGAGPWLTSTNSGSRLSRPTEIYP